MSQRAAATAADCGSGAAERVSWGTGLCVVSGVLDAVAAVAQNEALAVVARALLAIGDRIVDAGQHRRS